MFYGQILSVRRLIIVRHILLVLREVDRNMCIQKPEKNKKTKKTFNPSYLYKETKNSEAILVVECVHQIDIFSIVANKVQLSKG